MERELLSLYRKNYVAAGIVFMLHNYATRDRLDRDRGGEGKGEKLVVAAARNDSERANQGRDGKKSGWKSFSAAGRPERERATPSG